MRKGNIEQVDWKHMYLDDEAAIGIYSSLSRLARVSKVGAADQH